MDLPIFVHKVISRSRRLGLKIDQKNQLVVTSPPGVSEKVIHTFVLDHIDWITAHQNKNKRKPTFNTPKNVHVFGKEYQKTITSQGNYPLGVSIQGDELIIKLPTTTTEMTAISLNKKGQDVLERFLKTTATQYIVPRAHWLAEKMNTNFTKITLRDTSSRWGSCSSTGSVQFSWRLVHFVPAIIDYVIIHELAHRTHMNHSQHFWNLVAQYDPEFQIHRGALKRSIV